MKKLNVSVRFVLFAVFAVVTLAAPLSIVWKYESALHFGAPYKFRTRPVDPYDAFRGRYVTLSFKDNSLENSENDKGWRDGILYVRLKRDPDGFAVPSEVSREPFSSGDFVRVTVAGPSLRADKIRWVFNYPFDRYYLPEDVAPMAEQLYREANIRGGTSSRDGDSDSAKADTYVTVRVRNGVGVIEELYLNGVPVREAVRAKLLEQQKQKEREGQK